jgi:VWFA-related protein
MAQKWFPVRFLAGVFGGIGLLAAVLSTSAPAAAQTQDSTGAQQPDKKPENKPGQAPDQSVNQQPGDTAPPSEAGGPGGDVGPYVVPKKKDEAPAPPPSKPKKIEGMPDYSIRVDVPLVNVDVLVTTKDGQFVPGLKKENFRILEDGVDQKVTNFNQSEAPITAVMLIEFASTNYSYLRDALNSSYTFASQLKKDDWVAVVEYDMRTHILVDFTQDKREIMDALNTLRIPGFSERNLFDALYETLDRLDGTEGGRKYVILVSTGQDTFSKINYDTILKKVKATQNVTIYPVSIGRALRERVDARGGVGPIQSLDFLQADNQMNTFARMTGGKAYFPRFDGELPEIFHDIGNSIRNQYSLAYRPSNAKPDGTYRKLKVELIAPDGGPLKVRDQRGKDVKVNIIAREGYTAKHVVD